MKADLFSPGGEVFRDLSSIHVAASEEAEFLEIKLAAPSAPLGGKWGQAASVLLRFLESEAPSLRHLVAVPRTVFPSLGEKEFYVCDVVGFEVVDEEGRGYGRVSGFQDIAPLSGGSVNLRVNPSAGAPFEFPSVWVSEVRTAAQQLCVPEIGAWRDLDTGGKPDDA